MARAVTALEHAAREIQHVAQGAGAFARGGVF